KGRVAQRELPCVPVKEVEAYGHDRPDGDEEKNARQVSPHKEGEEYGNDEGQEPGCPCRRKGALQGLQTSLPNSPFGRNRSMTIMMAKTKARLYMALMYPDARLSTTPRMRLPTTAPAMLPSPPKIMAE